MEEHSTRNRRLSPTVEEAQRIVRLLTEEQLQLLCALDPTVEHAYSLPELGERIGWTSEHAESVYRAIGRIIQKELSASFDFDYMYQHGRTSWPNLLLDAVKRDRWYFTLGPELQAALVEEGILPPNKPRKAR